MEIAITQWALDSYLDLVSNNIFTRKEYFSEIRPDVMLLKKYPNDPKFSNSKFWSPANDLNGKVIPDGYKMKWHQIGNGRVQLRLTVGLLNGDGFLCEAYVKKDSKVDKRKLAKFKVYLELIRQERFVIRGKLS
jgi:hypothetical protein